MYKIYNIKNITYNIYYKDFLCHNDLYDCIQLFKKNFV